MHFVKSLFVGASVVVAAIAQSGKLGFTTVPTSVIAGTPTDLKWSGGDGSAVTITLKQGTPDNLKTIAIITGSATGDSFTWTPSKSLADGQDYAFQISQGVSDINYSGLFSLTGGSNAPESSKLTASSKTSASVASSKTSASKSTASVASVTSSLSSIFSSISAVSRNNTHVTTTVAPINATSSILIGTGFGTAVSSGGTGIPISRNTTLSHATLKSSSTKTESTTSSGPASTEASSTGTSPSASTSGKPNSAANLASPLAFIITAFVAIIYLG